MFVMALVVGHLMLRGASHETPNSKIHICCDAAEARLLPPSGLPPAFGIPTTTTTSTTSTTEQSQPIVAPRSTPDAASRTAYDPGPEEAGTSDPEPGSFRDLGVFLITCYDLSGTTASGEPVSMDAVAVDPRIIPLHTHLRIAGIGDRTALDTGSAVKGNHLDVWEPNCDGWTNPHLDVKARV